MTSTSIAPTTPAPTSGSIARILGVMVSPGETFRAIAERPTWLAPVLVSVVVALLLMTTVTTRVGWMRVMARQNQANTAVEQRLEQMTPQQREQALALQAKIAEPVAFAISTAGPFLFTLILAAIFLVLFKLLYGADIPLRHAMAVVSHAFVPRILYALLGIFVTFVKDPNQVQIQNFLASNPGAFLSSETARWVVVLATQFDLFTFWIMLLLAMGFHAVSPRKVSTLGAFAGIVGCWAVWVIFEVGLAAAFS